MSASRWTLGKRLLPVLAFLVIAGQGSRPGLSPAVEAQDCNPLLSNEIVCENRLAGNADWDIGTGAGDAGVQGFATDISVDQGETVRFKIDSDAAYRIHIYRLGYYGGVGGRKVAILPNATGTFPAQAQLACVADQNTGLVDCGNWLESATWTVPVDATSGVYVAKLERADTLGASHIHFVVRDDDGRSDILFQTSDTTWQAYNNYGGNSLYEGASHLGGGRAVAVSYNRPINTRAVDPRSFFFSGEYPMLRFLEANGYDVSYFTGVDTDRRGAEIREHKVFLSVGHDEYWSGTQRANVEAARDATPPVHLAFFSGNEAFWKTRWENDSFGASHRTLVSYKETHANGKIDPAVDPVTGPIWTGTWRDTRFGPHDGGRPENALSGTIFMVNDGVASQITVPAADGQLRFWRDTPNVSTQTSGAFTLAEDTLGFKWDEDLDNGSRPAGAIRLSSTTVTVGSKLLDNGSNYGTGVATHSLMLHRRSSGALVFGAGTVQWGYGLSSVHDGTLSTPSIDMQQATVNLFADMSVQPRTLQAGLQPATASTDTTAPSSQITSPAPGATLTIGTPIVITGTAADAAGRVAGVEVSLDGGATWNRANGRGSWTLSWTPTVAGTAVIRSRATDDSTNIETPLAGITVQVDAAAPSASTGPFSLWNNAPPTGAVIDHGDTGSVEVGVRFRSDVSGFITGIKFFKSSRNIGVHRGRIYNNVGTELASVTFTNETASGWQEMLFASPIPIAANAPYVAAYHAPQGQYAYTPGYFATAGYTNAPLHAYQNGVEGNGVYAYGPGQFPSNTFNGNHYWVDVVFATSLPADTTPPTVASIVPADLASDQERTTNVRVTFSESMNPSSITGSTVMLRDAANQTVPATLTYGTSTKMATINPTSPLNANATYHVLVKGGASGVKDSSGNAMAVDFESTFATEAPLPDPTAGPGGPILLVRNPSNHFTKYYAEILRAEGLNQFTVADIGNVTAAMLASHSVVLLAEMPLTPTQVTMFSNWVIGGGKLIAMRPDKQLASLLGLTDLGTTHANEYLLVQTASGPGVGIVNETIQYHGTADDYALNGATAVAELYSNATTPSGRPGVTWRAVGAGIATAFTYDLSRSVLLTRQGNPAWSGQDRDGLPPIRADDLFFGNATIAGGSLDANGSPLQDPQPDWVDLNKVAIPQADEQMRLLANLILHMSPSPVPRFWYFPHGKKAVVVMTGDDHNGGGTAGRFNIFSNDSPQGCSVADWTCIRSTSYIYAGSIDDTAASNFAQDGFEIALHLNSGCVNWTPTSLRAMFSDQLAGFAAMYPSLEPPSTHRIHCLVWSDYSTLPIVSLENGIRLDTSYYYWPASWIQDRPGFLTGSGIPMRHATANGEIIDVYQADIKMTDESEQTFPFTPATLFARAVGPQGYYGAFTANMHTDSPAHEGAQAILDEALPRGIPIVSAKQMLDWLDGRNASSFGNLTWNGTTLSFTISAGPNTRGLEAMLPTTMPGTSLTLVSVRRNGVALPIKRTETIKGVSYAFVEATTGAYEAVYDNGGAPVITSVSATGTADGTATFSWQTNAASSSRVQFGTSPPTLPSEMSNPALVTNHSLAPPGFVGGRTYYYRVTSVDASGMSSTAPPIGQAPASFVMPGPIVTAADVVAAESAANAAITLQMSNVAAQDVVVTFATVDGTATAGSDYTAISAETATIPAGSTTVVVNVPLVADAIDEADETFVVSFTGASNATLATTQVTVTITDDDAAPSISIADISVVEGNAGGANAVFTVTLSGPSSLPVSVDFATANDTAVAGSDYVASSGQLVMPAGQSSGQIVVPVVGDPVFEGHDRFAVSLSNPSNATIAQAQAFGTITNDDVVPSLSIGDVTVAEAGVGVNAVFTVTLSEMSGVDVVVSVATTDGTAFAGVDYTAGSGTVTIPAGSTTASVNVALAADALDEADETFTVTLSSPQNATILDGSATATITDDDAMPSLSINDVTVAEGQTGTVNPVFTVSLSAASGRPVSVNVATADGTATAGGDYVARSTSLNFAAGQTKKVVEVVVNGDRLDEADETFVVNLTSAVNATIADAQATGTMTDDDASPVAAAGTATTNEDTAVVIDVLANVTDADADTLTLEAVGQGTHGAVRIITTGLDAGKVSYTPNENFFGTDSFTYTVSDANGNSTNGAVTVTVTSVNDAPDAVNDGPVTVNEDSAAAAIAVLANDTDPDNVAPTAANAGLTVTAVTPGVNGGRVTFTATGVSYTPAPGYVGPDSFTYNISDGSLTDTATVNVTVADVNDAPNAVNDGPVTVNEDSAATAIAVLANDTDPDNVAPTAANAGLTVTAVTPGVNGGRVTFTATGVSYAPAPGYVGPDSFTYTISDGSLTDTATVTIMVANVNGAPVLGLIGNRTTAEGTTLSFVVSATDGDNDTLTYSATGLPTGASFDPLTRTFSWTPGFSAAGSYPGVTVTVSDGTASDSEAITITVTNANQAPVLTAIGSKSVNERALLTFTISATDPDNDSLTYSAGALPAGAMFTAATGTFSWTPSGGQAGTHSVTFTVTDSGSSPLTDSETVAIIVKPAATTITTPTSSLNPSTYGQAVRFTATVTGTDTGKTPTGNVTFYDGALSLGTATLDEAGKASYTTSAVSAGTRSITATYSGDARFATSTSAALTQSVNKATATGTFVTLTPIQKQYSDRVTMEVTVSPATATGTVTFQIGTQVLATAPIVNGKATANPQLLGTALPGSKIVTAVFNTPNYTIANVAESMSIIKEDARVAYSGPATLCMCGNTSVPITVNVSDITAVNPVSDPDAGDVGNATVTFMNRTTLATLGTVTVIPNVDRKTGTATFNLPASALGTSSSATITFGFVVRGSYNRNSSLDNAAVTITK